MLAMNRTAMILALLAFGGVLAADAASFLRAATPIQLTTAPGPVIADFNLGQHVREGLRGDPSNSRRP